MKKALTVLCFIVCLSIPTIAQAATYQGADRYETAALIAIDSGEKDLTIASGENFPDALSAINIGNPVLLAKVNEIPQVTMQAIYTIEPNSITIVGGMSVISAEVESQLSNYCKVTRIAGANRYETNALTISGTDIPATVASGENWPDALSASNLGNQIFLVKHDSIPNATMQALTAANPYSIIIVGGTGAVSQQVEEGLKPYCQPSKSIYRQVTRLAGADRYATNLLTIGDFSTLNVVTGRGFPDALAAAFIGDQTLLFDGQQLPDWCLNVMEYNFIGGVDKEAFEAIK